MGTFERFAFSGESDNCYGLELVADALRRHGHTVRPYNIGHSDPILFSLYWPEQLFDFLKWRYHSAHKGRRIIVGGNSATTNPAPLLAHGVDVYLGDGEVWDGEESPHLLRPGNAAPASIAQAQRIEPIQFEDTQQTRRSFCEMSRGCKNKCLFCQYGWLKPYREADIADIRQVVLRSRTKSIRLFAADRFQHSRYADLRGMMSAAGKNDTGSDASVRFLLEHPEYMAFTRKVRTGIEGMSERLRFMVGKRLTDDDICALAESVWSAGIGTFDWYMIYGLPSERAEDIDAFRVLLGRLDQMAARFGGKTIAVHWNAFTPSAMTPYQWEGVMAYDYPYRKDLERLMSAPLRSLKVYHKPKMSGKDTLARRMVAIRGGESTRSLAYTMAMKPAQFRGKPDQLLAAFNAASGYDLMASWPLERPFPWDEHVDYRKDLMRRARDNGFKRFAHGAP